MSMGKIVILTLLLLFFFYLMNANPPDGLPTNKNSQIHTLDREICSIEGQQADKRIKPNAKEYTLAINFI